VLQPAGVAAGVEYDFTMVTRDEGSAADSGRGNKRAADKSADKAADKVADKVRLTSRDIAAVAGVSQATVSRVLSGTVPVRDSTREAVLRALELTGYAPNASARTMRSGRTGAIGVVVANMTNPFYPHLLEALSNAIHAVDHRMVVWDGRRGGEDDAVTAIREKAVDSVVFTTATPDSVPLREALRQDLPVVLVNRSLPRFPYDSVTSDNIAGAATVARYLHDGGRKVMAMVGGLAGTSTADERLRGFRSGLTRAGRAKSSLTVVGGGWAYEEGARCFEEILRLGPPPDALFCANDVLAFGAIDAARAAGLRVPEDLWVVGYDDISISAWAAYDLTTLRQPLAEMAAEAVRLALFRLADPGRSAERTRLSSQLVVRGSTDHFEPPWAQGSGANAERP
jgi:LacI family transcriptional regulator